MTTNSRDREVPRFVVAIPVRNEGKRVGACLDALARQKGLASGTLGVVLFLNGCTDGTRGVIDDLAQGLPFALRVVEGCSERPSAGWARRMAMETALAWMNESGATGGVLLTSDADSRVCEDWVSLNVAAIAAGADAVCGRIALDPAEAAALPNALHARGRLEAIYEVLLTEIGARIDPEPGNPWPCHWGKSGATIAAKASVYRAIGGMPDIACGEDRAFVDAVRAAGFVVRHAPEIEVLTSGRLDGRASGGVADTIRLRCEDLEAPCDDRLESLGRFLFRSIVNRLLRRYGAAHPRLAFRPLTPSELPRQIRRARLVNRLLRARDLQRRHYRGSVPNCNATADPRSPKSNHNGGSFTTNTLP